MVYGVVGGCYRVRIVLSGHAIMYGCSRLTSFPILSLH